MYNNNALGKCTQSCQKSASFTKFISSVMLLVTNTVLCLLFVHRVSFTKWGGTTEWHYYTKKSISRLGLNDSLWHRPDSTWRGHLQNKVSLDCFLLHAGSGSLKQSGAWLQYCMLDSVWQCVSRWSLLFNCLRESFLFSLPQTSLLTVTQLESLSVIPLHSFIDPKVHGVDCVGHLFFGFGNPGMLWSLGGKNLFQNFVVPFLSLLLKGKYLSSSVLTFVYKLKVVQMHKHTCSTFQSFT